ncbi:MAG TPA: glycosyltransferase [Niabella sp.]|nr:glycosyltransferase [Niabella sp.]
MSTLKGKDIIIVGQQSWDTEIGSNCKDIALEFSKYNRVLYVNSALDRITKQRRGSDPKIQKRLRVIKGEESGLIKIAENLYNLYPDQLTESINWIPFTTVFDWFNKRNNKKFADSILKAVERLGFKDYLLFNDNDMFRSYYLKEYLRPVLSAYYSRDNMVGVDYWKRHGLKLEPALIAKSDLCVANSEYLSSYCKQYNHNSFYVGQGCDFTFFKNEYLNPPEDIKGIAKPIIGYVGALLTSRLNLSLLEEMAGNNPGWNIVLVGPEDNDFQNSSLHSLQNVHFLGSKQANMLPAYINSFDVCINPQVVNPITIGNYPRKVDEYLALGKPTVVTNTQTMSSFRDYVYLANDNQDYEAGIKSLLNDNDEDLRAKRKAFALSHTWENSVAMIYDAFLEVAAQKGLKL